MAFARCPWPVWEVDNITECFQRDFLETLFPGFISSISILLLVSQLVQQSSISTWINASQTTAPNEPCRSRQQYTIIIEVLAIFGAVIVRTIAFIQAYGSKQSLAALTGLVFWSYVLVLASAQLVLSRSYSKILKVENHLAVIYAFQWLLSIVLFWSTITHPPSRLSQTLTIFEFAVSMVLFFLAVTTQNGYVAALSEWEEGLEPSKETPASPFSRLTFSWVYDILRKGYRKPLEMPDVWNLTPKDKASAALIEYRQVKRTTNLAWHLLYYVRFSLLKQWACSFISASLAFASILLLKAILEYIENPNRAPLTVLCLYVILLSAISIIQSLLSHQAIFIGSRVRHRIRAIVTDEIYAKALQRKASNSNDTETGSQRNTGDVNEATNLEEPLTEPAQLNVGTILNLMSSDSYSIAGISDCLHELTSKAPVQLFGCIVLLWHILGLSSIPGLVIMISFVPVNLAFSSSYGKEYKKILVATDKRIHTINETLQNIRILKYFALQNHFARIVDEKRSTELKARFRTYLIWAGVLAVGNLVPLMVACCSFLAYTLFEKKPLYSSVAFPALSLFSILREPLNQITTTTFYIEQFILSTKRVDGFLIEKETGKYAQLFQSNVDEGCVKIGFADGSFSWDEKSASPGGGSGTFRLKNLRIDFAVGKLNIVAGSTGSGKTAMLMALLGEMTIISGKVFWPRVNNPDDIERNPETGLSESVAYCAQQAWIMNATIKQNIIFASPMHEQRYREVLKACALEQDLEVFESGDQTLVGEKGISLSGGQKQRISLARAVYSYSRHLLLDDCLSSVGSETGNWIFDNCIMGPLMRNRTCILVTNNVNRCVPSSQYVVVLENGKVAAQGTPEEVAASGKLDADICKTRKSPEAPGIPTGIENECEQDGIQNSQSTLSRCRTKNYPNYSKDAMYESKAVGGVKLDVIFLYLKSMGSWWFWLSGILVFTSKLLLDIAPSLWIRQWVNQYDAYNVSSTSSRHVAHDIPMNRQNPHMQEVDATYNLVIYALLGLGQVAMAFLNFLWYIYGSSTAASHIHQQLVKTVYHLKFHFFDVTPLGQLINRFAKDIKCIDQEVIFTARSVVQNFVAIVVSVIMIVAIAPAFLLPTIFISLMYLAVGMFYIRSSRDLKRLKSVQASPLFQHFEETLAGITTIRAYGYEKCFKEENFRRIDTCTRPSIYFDAALAWLSLRLDAIGALVTLVAGTIVIFGIETVDAGSAGLIFISATSFTESLPQLVQIYATLEQNMNSMERIKEYLDAPQEDQSIGDATTLPADWPNQGSVEFVDYTTCYRPDQPVLKNVSFRIAAGEKAGVVGRTGAGKSSLGVALLRALEADSGEIRIGGFSIKHVPLDHLRDSIAFVPQDPTLLSGTIRTNLDPFSRHTDADILAVLQHVLRSTELSPIYPSGAAVSKPGPDVLVSASALSSYRDVLLNLSTPVAESGNNFSHGERQLLCLAQALLKKAPLLILDEATASLDYNQDARVQEIIGGLQCTTITIAHRLQTIIDYDKVLVLDNGEVVEFGRPYELLGKPGKGGAFKNMCANSGDLESLREAAKTAYAKSQLVDVE